MEHKNIEQLWATVVRESLEDKEKDKQKSRSAGARVGHPHGAQDDGWADDEAGRDGDSGEEDDGVGVGRNAMERAAAEQWAAAANSNAGSSGASCIVC